MILKKLTYRNAFGEDGTFSFSVSDGRISVAEIFPDGAAARALETAAYGADERDFAELDNAEIILEFELGEAVYRLTRTYRDGGEATELSSEEGETTLTLSPKKTKEILKAVFGKKNAAFTDASEYLKNALSERAPSAAEILEKQREAEEKQFRAEEEMRAVELLSARIGTPQFPEIDLDAIEAERESVIAQLRRAAEKERVAKEAKDAKDALTEFISKNGDVMRLQETLNRDDRLREARAETEKREAARKEAEQLKVSLSELGSKSDAVRKKSLGGDEAEKECEADFILKSERVNALRKKFMDEMCASDDENSEIRRSLDAYYAANDPRIQELNKKKKRLDNEYEALLLSITSLENKKKGLVRPMSYKKAVIDGTVLEYKIEKLTAAIEDGNRRSGELQLEISAKEEDIRDAEAEFKRKTLEKAELTSRLLKGKFPTLEEAINADQALKNEVYAAFVTAENLTAEIDALNEKIANLKRQNGENDEKRKELQNAKTEIEVRLVKLKHKKESYENEYRGKCAQNLFAEEAEKLRFGDRCPVCDSYVVKKNEITKTTTEATSENIRKVQSEIVENEKRLDRILLKLGAYLSTEASGDAYIVSLQNTLVKKESLLKRIYRSFGAENKDEFGKAIEKIGAESASFNEGILKLNEIGGSIAAESEKKNVLQNAVLQLSGRESKRIRAIVEASQTELEIALQEYRKLMPVFGGRPAKELLSGSLIDDIELETVDGDLVSQTKNFREVTVQKIETDRILILLKNKLISDLKDTEAESALDVALRETSRKAKESARELDEAEAALEDAKLKLAAVRRVNRNAEKEIYGADTSAAAIRLKIAAAEASAVESDAKAAEILEAVGVTEEKLSASILSNAERNKAEKTLREFAEKKQRLEYRADFTASRPVTLEFIDVEALKARGAELDKLAADAAVRIAKYEYLSETAKELIKERDALAEKIKSAEAEKETLSVWAGALKDEAIDFEALTRAAEEKANAILCRLSGANDNVSADEISKRAAKFSSELAAAILKKPFETHSPFLIAVFGEGEDARIARIPTVADDVRVAVFAENKNA